MKKNAAFSASPAKELMTIPDAGKSTAEDLANIGITSIADLKGKNPQKLFEQSNQIADLQAVRKTVSYFTFFGAPSILPTRRPKNAIPKN